MELPATTIDNYELTYLGSTITSNPSLDIEIYKRTGKAATPLARLTLGVWANVKLTMKTKMVVYNACVVSTLMYSSETWTTYARKEKRFNSFHLRSIRRILGISWQDRVSNAEALSRANLPSMFTMLKQRSAGCVVWVMSTAWGVAVSPLPPPPPPPKKKTFFCRELASERRTKGFSQLRYKHVYKRDMKALAINTESWEGLAADLMRQRSTLNQQLKSGEEKLMNKKVEKKARRKESKNSNRRETTHKCDLCYRDFFSHTGEPGCSPMIKLEVYQN